MNSKWKNNIIAIILVSQLIMCACANLNWSNQSKASKAQTVAMFPVSSSVFHSLSTAFPVRAVPSRARGAGQNSLFCYATPLLIVQLIDLRNWVSDLVLERESKLEAVAVRSRVICSRSAGRTERPTNLTTAIPTFAVTLTERPTDRPNGIIDKSTADGPTCRSVGRSIVQSVDRVAGRSVSL